MGERNQTSVREFILLGFSEHPLLQGLICGTVLLIYLISMLGNFVFLTLMCADPHLHKPMYFFLSNLSILDICCPSATLPKMLGNFLTKNKAISFRACMSQLYFFESFTSTELFLLSAMAYDRCVAICNPLRYSLIMNRSICVLLAAVSWIIGFVNALPLIDLVSQFYYCESNEVNHFFCDIAALMKLSCSDVWRLETLIFAEGTITGFIPFLLTLISYIFIISSILRIRGTEGRHKAFSTCTSHLTSVSLFYGTLLCIYMRPASMYSPAQDKLFSLLYTALIPTLNPIIYSLRNREIKNSFRRIMGQTRMLVN
ncbi:olfactory receptor 5I1-like [Rhinatrema bivittatum]|uniref:olfactory receptor 5I1-like n=1 Tax=Rhinatrema bivittatum TaxID=194408 RepID=UPI00112C2C75|nr:olfactory receptor 5I1-like [Rhinatrema bivittatum]